MISFDCHPGKIKDLSQGLGEIRHYYCIVCKSHFYKNKLYSKKEWEIYIEDFNSSKKE